jgi:bacterioferritin
MMDIQRVVAGLNKILSLEYAAALQYMQHSYLIQGVERRYLSHFFRDQAKECLDKHSRQIGDKVVALGGVPTVEPGTIKQSTDCHEMLWQDLEMERSCQDAQKELLEEVHDDVALRVMLEQMIWEEQENIEHLEKLLAQNRPMPMKEVELRAVGGR